MKLSGLHLLLTYQCNFECDHCFVWGGPRQRGTMTLAQVRDIIRQAGELGSVSSLCFEGGEPFLYYAVLLAGVREAADAGFEVGIVSNGYWATEVADAAAWLEPMAGSLKSLTLSSDLFHYGQKLSRQATNAKQAAEGLGIRTGVITIEQPKPPREGTSAEAWGVKFRGRAAERLGGLVRGHAPRRFTECPCEDLREPGRVHVDPAGNVHICQGIVVGNLFRRPLTEICAGYDPDAHPIAGPLLAGGPIELARRYGLPSRERCADACHLCYRTRVALRDRFADALGPGQMYGCPDE